MVAIGEISSNGGPPKLDSAIQFALIAICHVYIKSPTVGPVPPPPHCGRYPTGTDEPKLLSKFYFEILRRTRLLIKG